MNLCAYKAATSGRCPRVVNGRPKTVVVQFAWPSQNAGRSLAVSHGSGRVSGEPQAAGRGIRSNCTTTPKTATTGRCFIQAILLLLLPCNVAHAALPETLPYGTDNLPVPLGPRVNGTNPKVVDALGGMLDDPYSIARVKVMSEIGACELPAGGKYVRQGLADPDAVVRAEAARAAAKVGDPALAEDLKKLQGDSDADVRRAVVLSGGAMQSDAIVAAGLVDGDPTVIAAAVSVAMAGQSATLASTLPKYPPATQVLAIRSLGRIGDARHAGAVAPFLAVPAVPLRSAAAEAIGLMRAADHTAAVERLLADPHPTVRRSALSAMAYLVPVEDFQKKLIMALADADRSVRENAANLLAKSPTPDAIEPLASNLAVDNARLHAAARDALVAVGPPVIPRAQKLLADTDPRRREDGSYILGRLKSDASLDVHITLAKDADWRVVRQAAQSLGLIGRKEAAPALAELANRAPTISKDLSAEAMQHANEAAEQAIVACTYLGEPSILPVCRSVFPDKSKALNVRCAAVYAVGRMDSPNDPGIARAMTGVIGDIDDAQTVKEECVKALGQLKSPAARGVVGVSRETAAFAGGPATDWLCHWVRWKLTGQDIPYDPLPDAWNAPVSVNLMEN